MARCVLLHTWSADEGRAPPRPCLSSCAQRARPLMQPLTPLSPHPPNLATAPLHIQQLNGSLARAAIRELASKGLIKPVAEHAQQKIYTRAVGA